VQLPVCAIMADNFNFLPFSALLYNCRVIEGKFLQFPSLSEYKSAMEHIVPAKDLVKFLNFCIQPPPYLLT